MPDQHYLFEPPVLCEVDPGGKIAHLFTGYAPVTTTADTFFPMKSGDGPEVMHARISRDARIAAFREGAAGLHVRRVVKVHPPAVDPDDGDGPCGLFRR